MDDKKRVKANEIIKEFRECNIKIKQMTDELQNKKSVEEKKELVKEILEVIGKLEIVSSDLREAYLVLGYQEELCKLQGLLSLIKANREQLKLFLTYAEEKK